MDAKQESNVKNILGLLQDDRGFAGREIPGARWPLPDQVKVEGDRLLYHPVGFLRPYATDKFITGETKQIATVEGALDEFIRLTYPSRAERHSSSDIAEFATRWGGLWLCRHGLPYSHSPIDDPADPSSYFTRCLPTVVGEMFAEPIERWRELATSAFLIMRFAADLRRAFDLQTDRSSRRTLIQVANKWLSKGRVTVELVDAAPDQNWPAGIEFRLSAGIGLYGALAAQLAMAITLSRQFYVCAECGKIFTPEPKHRPRTGRRAFCQKCGHAAAVRHAMRDMRRPPLAETQE